MTARLLAAAVLLCAAQLAHAEDAVKVSVWAASAFNSGIPEKTYETGLEAVKPLLERLSYDTFKLVKGYSGKSLSFGKATSLQINSEYSLVIQPISREEDGRVRMKVSVEMPPKEKGKAPVEALSATLLVKLDDKIKLEGLHSDKGELIIIFQAQ